MTVGYAAFRRISVKQRTCSMSLTDMMDRKDMISAKRNRILGKQPKRLGYRTAEDLRDAFLEKLC